MEFPNELKYAIEKQTPDYKHKQLIQDAQTLSLRYRTKSGEGKRLLTNDNEAAAYSLTRMPATYGAVFTSLKYSLAATECVPSSVLDVGAGTGAASWATASLINLSGVICLEREDAMCRIGQNLMSEAPYPLSQATWIQRDIISDDFSEKADLVIASYVLNELAEKDREKVLLKLWESTNMMLLIVEPGTPAAYSQMLHARRILKGHGAHIAAPCPHESDCMLMQDDWCHFSCRIPRSRLHRELKSGDVPYEDEKFTYLCVSRNETKQANARVLRHPYIEKGQITLNICCSDKIHQIKVRKKDGDLYKQARKVKWGDEVYI